LIVFWALTGEKKYHSLAVFSDAKAKMAAFILQQL
jgi:hypothetical protein